MGSHSVTCHPAEVTFPPLPQPSWYSIKRPRRDAELSWPSWLVTYRDGIPARPKTVTHPGTNRARRGLTSFMRRTPLTTTPRRQRQLGVELAAQQQEQQYHDGQGRPPPSTRGSNFPTFPLPSLLHSPARALLSACILADFSFFFFLCLFCILCTCIISFSCKGSLQ